MTTAKAKWYHEFLDAAEPAIIAFESSKEPGAAEVAAAGAFGLVGGAVGGAVGAAAARTLTTTAHQKTEGAWDGLVVLTKQRLLLIDGHGIVRSLDRSQIRSLRLSGSKAGAWHSRIEIESDAGTCHLHTPLKAAHVLAKHFTHQGSVEVDTNEGSALDIFKAIPIIVLFFGAAIAIAVGLGSGNWLAVLIGGCVLFGTERLRRVLFRKDAALKT